MEIAEIQDDDSVFRGLPVGTEHYERRGSVIIVKQSAFNDRGRRPSVDVARLSPNGEPRAQLVPSAGIISLQVGAIRKLSVVQQDQKGKEIAQRSVDVIHRPETANPAHAQIEASPDFDSDGQFKRLKVMLARIAEWRVPPP